MHLRPTPNPIKTQPRACVSSPLLPIDLAMEHTAAAAEVELPDDAVREILIRVADEAALFRCATTCKRWRGIVADRSFLRRRWPEDSPGSSSLLGFFAPGQLGEIPRFVPAPRSSIDRCNSSYLSSPTGLLDGAVPLVSRHGLLLVRLRHAVSDSDGAIHLAVCNPLIGTCDVLPALAPRPCFHTICYAILTNADCSLPSYSTFSKVVIISSRCIDIVSPNEYDLHLFSFNEPKWTLARECLSTQQRISRSRRRPGDAAILIPRDPSGDLDL
jgi:hypothetical protein